MRNQRGFTLIEILMVVILVAIMALVAIPQFLDFQTESKNAALKGALGAIRTGIANQKANMIMRCGAAGDAWPAFTDVFSNSIVASDCTVGQVPTVGDRAFVSGNYPVNPWSNIPTSAEATTVVTAVAGAIADHSIGCDGLTLAQGWCYDPASGDFWADSQNNAGAAGLEDHAL